MSRWTCIVPTYSAREEVFKKFMEAWTPIFEKHDVTLVVMFDGQDAPHWLSLYGAWVSPPTVWVKTWADVDEAGLRFIPKQTDMVRSFAMWWAYKNTDAEYFLTLDDDCLPQEGVDIFEEYEKVFENGAVLSEYLDVGALTTSGLQMRGFPYKPDREPKPVAVQYGGWHNVLDYDAATQMARPKSPQEFHPIVMPVPKGAAATCCIMNCAWQRKYTPIMWQLPMLDGRYNRVGDIWSGLFIKKTLDAIGATMVINGKASIMHDRASNPYESLKKEAPSVWLNDNLWEALESKFHPEWNPTLLDAYITFTSTAQGFLREHDKEYAEHFLKARDEWLALWK